MRPVGDAMAIAMRDVEKIDRKILVADLQIFAATSEVANTSIYRYFPVLFGCGFSQMCLQIFATDVLCSQIRQSKGRKYSMGYLLHLRPHLRAQKHLLPANLLFC